MAEPLGGGADPGAQADTPGAPAVNFDAVPTALRQRAQWLLWRFEPHPRGRPKPLKVPYYADGGKRVGEQGSDRDRRRLVAFERVRAVFERGGWSGIGFAFLPDDGVFGIDIDAAIDRETGEVNAQAQAMIRACDSWTELSPSGLGAHIFMRGRTATHKVNASDGRIGVEIFCGSQFFTVTGRTWPGAPPQLREAGAKLLVKLHKTVDALKAARAAPAPAAAEPNATAGRAAPPNDRSSERRRRELVEALAATSAAACGYDEWVSVGMILKAELGDAAGFVEWDRWSALDADRYPGTEALARKWRSFRDPAGGDLVFKLARAAGWRPKRAARQGGHASASTREASDSNPPPAGGGDAGPHARGGQHGGGGPPDDDEPPRLGRDDRGRPRRFPFRNDKGMPMSIRENVVFALLHDPTLAGLVAHNEFTELHERTRTTPWGAPPGEWDAIDDLHLAEYLALRHGLIMRAVGQVQEAVSLAASRNKVHPLRTWLNSLVWDGTARLNHWLVDCLGAPAREYVRLAGRMFLIGMVARVMRPGCKMDYALILQGAQGAGKSTAFRALAEPWFADTVFKIGDKDALMSVQGVWLYELSELDALSKSEHTAAKAFISSQEDRFRPPYGTRMQKVPRRVVMCGTTNADQFLSDATGDRRYWPIHVRDIDVDALRAMREQLFAEAVHAFAAGEKWFPTREQERDLFVPEQDRYKLVDVWADYLSAYVNSRVERTEDEDGEPLTPTEVMPNCERTFFSTQELISKALRIEAGRIDSSKQMQRRVSQAMQQIGFVADRQPDGKRKRGYTRRPPPAAPAPETVPIPGVPAPPTTQGPAGHPPEAPPQSPQDRARAALNDVEVAL